MPPRTTLWPLTRHTEAKHRVLKRYLEAWLPIVAHVPGRELWLVDGFAGPGEYSKGERGSPTWMIDVYTGHKARADIDSRKQIRFVFIEKVLERKQHLDGQVARRLEALGSATVEVMLGDFGALMPDVTRRIRERAAGAFLFIDPFGYEETDPALTTPILAQPHCETLTFVPIEHMARFAHEDRMAATLTSLFWGDRWRGALAFPGTAGRIVALREAYVAMLREDARWVRSFKIESDASEFALFFATNHPRGLEKMKEAMWSVDPIGGTTFSDSTAPGQEVFFADADVSGAIEALIRTRKGWWRYDALEASIEETAYLPKHLRSEIDRLQAAGRIQVIRSGRHLDADSLITAP